MFSIGWVRGPDLRHLQPDGARPMLTGSAVAFPAGSYVADPFWTLRAHGIQAYFEIYDSRIDRGCIATARFSETLGWTHPEVVCREPFHLSYPHPIREPGCERLFVVESADIAQVRLYRADADGLDWQLDCVLLDGERLLDPTPVKLGDDWYLFAARGASVYDELALFAAPTLRGPWREHASSPVVVGDAARARPAGPVIRCANRLLRPAQDCSRRYGERMLLREIVQCDRRRYSERDYGWILAAGCRPEWQRGSHHIDVLGTGGGVVVALADGYVSVPGRRP